jgi:predicted dehydrogenase
MFCSIGAKRPQVDRTVIYGTKGTLYKDGFGTYLYLDKASDEPIFEGMNQQHIRVHIPVSNVGHNTTAEVQEFCAAILEGRESSCPGVDGAITAYTCMAMVESSKTGKPVKMNYDFL